MTELTFLVLRWLAAFLLAVSMGSVGAATGHGELAAAIGALLFMMGAVFTLATIVVNNQTVAAQMQRTDTADGALVGSGLHRAVVLGVSGAGLAVGGLGPIGPLGLLGGFLGFAALVLAGRETPRRDR